VTTRILPFLSETNKQGTAESRPITELCSYPKARSPQESWLQRKWVGANWNLEMLSNENADFPFAKFLVIEITAL